MKVSFKKTSAHFLCITNTNRMRSIAAVNCVNPTPPTPTKKEDKNLSFACNEYALFYSVKSIVSMLNTCNNGMWRVLQGIFG